MADIRFSNVDKKTESGECPVRLCNYTDVYNNDYIGDEMEFMRATATQPEIDRFGLKIGDVIITKDSETPHDIGVPTVVDSARCDLVSGYHLALIRPDQDKIEPTFLAKQLGHWRIARYFGQQANGSTRYGLSNGAIAGAPLWFPHPEQQWDISRILRAVDAAIATTQAVIAKLKNIRAGLLYDLLTRGLDHNGELRNPDRHPEQFKDSPLGRIPKEWRILTLRECLLDSPQNGIYKPARQIGYGANRKIDLSVTRRAEVDSVEVDRFGLQDEDILVSRVYATLAGVGQPALVPTLSEPAVYESNMMRLRVNRDQVLPRLLFELLRDHRVRKRVIATANLSNQASINQFGLNPIPVSLPPGAEQENIVNQMLVHEQSLIVSESELKKLREFKSGITSDLLTGRVPVTKDMNAEHRIAR